MFEILGRCWAFSIVICIKYERKNHRSYIFNVKISTFPLWDIINPISFLIKFVSQLFYKTRPFLPRIQNCYSVLKNYKYKNILLPWLHPFGGKTFFDAGTQQNCYNSICIIFCGQNSQPRLLKFFFHIHSDLLGLASNVRFRLFMPIQSFAIKIFM